MHISSENPYNFYMSWHIACHFLKNSIFCGCVFFGARQRWMCRPEARFKEFFLRWDRMNETRGNVE